MTAEDVEGNLQWTSCPLKETREEETREEERREKETREEERQPHVRSPWNTRPLNTQLHPLYDLEHIERLLNSSDRILIQILVFITRNVFVLFCGGLNSSLVLLVWYCC